MQRIAQMLGRRWRLVPYKGADFNGIFAGGPDRPAAPIPLVA